MRIEFLADRIEARDAVALEDIEQFAIGHLDAGDQIADGLRSLLERIGMGEIEGAAHIVADAQDIAGKIRRSIERRFGALALAALAQIVHVGKGAQQLVLEPADFLLERHDFQVALVERRHRADIRIVRERLAHKVVVVRRGIISHGFVSRLVGHERSRDSLKMRI